MTDRSVETSGNIEQSVVVTGDGNRVSLSFSSELRIPLARNQVQGLERRQQRPDERLWELDVLDPSRGRLPLLGRDAEIAALKAWLDADVDISVHALIGAAGTGKTRLAIGLCAEIDGGIDPGMDWVAGFISTSELPAIANALATRSFGWDRSTLLVVDYAAQQHDALGRWLDLLVTQRLEEGRKLRLLLLEREAPEGFGWWHDLTGSKLGSSQARLDLFWDRTLKPERLSGLDDLEVRRQLVSAALAATCALCGEEGGRATIPAAGADPAYDKRLGELQFATPLSLVMAGMIAREKGASEALALRRLDAARHLAGRELDRLKKLAGAEQARAMAHLVAFNGLVGGLPLSGLNGVVKDELAETGLVGDPGRLSELLQQEFPVPPTRKEDAATLPRLGTIQPDLIGEGVVIEAFENAPPAIENEGAATVQRAYQLGEREAAAALMRLLQDYAFALEDATATDQERATAKLLMGWLNALAKTIEEPEAIEPLAFALPQQTLVLRERALELTARLAEASKARAAQSEDLQDVHRAAVWLNNLASRLSALGRREEALTAAEEGVALYRILAAAQPDAFTPDLAASLNNLANPLSALGRREEALTAAEESVALYRTLAAARPDAFTPDLAMSLSNLASRLSAVGRGEEALTAAEEAVALRRILAAARPDAFTPDLANSLNNLANRLSDLGRGEEALTAAEEANALRRTLAAGRPDAFTPDLAMSLNNLANFLSALRRGEEALTAAEEAVALRRTLAAARPDAFTVDLSTSLGMMSDVKNSNGDQSGAFDAIAEAIEVLAPIFQELPEAVAHWMGMHIQRYIALCKELDREPDVELIGPILQIFGELKARQKG